MGLLRIKLTCAVFLFLSCTKDKGLRDNGSNYPAKIASILITKCAISGCHNNLSKDAAAGLSLLTWENLFEGGRGGSVLIPYRPDFSTICYYTNTYPELGPVLQPGMPLGLKPLTKNEFLELNDWILSGAPSADGRVKFKNSTNKLYIINQLCDLVMVLDGETKLPMRCINVGTGPKSEFPVCIKVAPDKKYWYLSFLASHSIQKFDAATDAYLGQIDLGEGTWSAFEISADSKFAYCLDNNSSGTLACVDLDRMKVISRHTSTDFSYPKAMAINNRSRKIYFGAEFGNYITCVDWSPPLQPIIKQIILDGSQAPINYPVNDPGFLLMEQALNQCFVACRNSKEIKIVDTQKDSVIKTVLLNAEPTSMDYDPQRKQLLVTCMNDSISFPQNLGSVKVISLQSYEVIKTIYTGYQPNGIRINTAFGYAAVVNSNINPKGPKPHHTSACNGRNGYVTFIDLNTLELIPSKKFELAVYPTTIDLKN